MEMGVFRIEYGYIHFTQSLILEKAKITDFLQIKMAMKCITGNVLTCPCVWLVLEDIILCSHLNHSHHYSSSLKAEVETRGRFMSQTSLCTFMNISRFRNLSYCSFFLLNFI